MPRRALSLLLVAVVVSPTGVTAGGSATRRCFSWGGGNRHPHGVMHGDVNGDGRRDAVYVKARRRSGRCRYWLVADTGRVLHRKRLRRNQLWPGDRYNLRRNTRPIGLVRVDRVPGVEIALNRAQGAAVGALAFFTLRDHRLVRMAPTGKRAPPDGLFGYAGSLSYIYGVDCVTKGRVIASAARPRNYDSRRRKWWVVKRDSSLYPGVC